MSSSPAPKPVIVLVRRFRPHWPGLLLAVGAAALASWAFGLPVETIGSRFGGIPSTMPWPTLPAFSPDTVHRDG